MNCIAVAIALPLLVAPGLRAAEPIPFADAPHLYWQSESHDLMGQLAQRLASGEFQPDRSSEKACLESMLKELDIDPSSQLLVYSATSLQSGLIRPDNPRALYFNDEVYVGFVPGGKMEAVAIDPALGPVFYITENRFSDPSLRFARSQRCMNCHAGEASRHLPGFFAESVIPMLSGASLEGFRRGVVGHTIPLKDRLGGWHVTGANARGEHLGNLIGENQPRAVKRVPNPPGVRFDWSTYLVQTSDLLPHLIHEHQLGFHNLVTLAVYRAREATQAHGSALPDPAVAQLNDIARQFVRYLLFADEAKLPSGGVRGDAAFMKGFAAKRKASPQGASLRDLDLRTHLMKHRCSYLIHSPGFAAMPAVIKDRVLAGLRTALRETGGPAEFNYLPATEKRAISMILASTGVMEARTDTGPKVPPGP
jgi:hypothetical protein